MHRFAALFFVVFCSAAAFGSPSTNGVDFVRDIQPMLTEKCLSCHGTRKQEGHLRWDNRESALSGGEHGPNVIPGNSAKSRVVRLVSSTNDDEIMPQKGDPLTEQQIATLRI